MNCNTLDKHSSIFAKMLLLHGQSHSPLLAKLCIQVIREIATFFGSCSHFPITCLTRQERKALKESSYRFAKVRLIFCQSRSPLLSKLCANVTREIASYFGHCKYLPITWGGLMLLYDIETYAKVTFPISYRLMRAPLCVISEVDWLLFRYLPDRRSVSSMNFLDYQIRSEERMSEEKSYFGVVQYCDFVWTFGGRQEGHTLKTCEKFNTRSRRWARMPSMTFKYDCFTPCVYQDEIYLPALTYLPQALEIFSPSRDCYRLTQWTWTHSSYSALEFICDDILFVSYVPIGVRKIDLHTGKERAEYRELQQWYLGTDTVPMQVGGKILWGSGGYVFQFQLSTGKQQRVTKIINEEYEGYTGVKMPKRRYQ